MPKIEELMSTPVKQGEIFTLSITSVSNQTILAALEMLERHGLGSNVRLTRALVNDGRIATVTGLTRMALKGEMS